MSDRRVILALTGERLTTLGNQIAVDLHERGIEIHLILPEGLRTRVKQAAKGEPGGRLDRLAHQIHADKNIGAPMSSGSWDHRGMLIVPTPPEFLGDISRGVTNRLISRAADVTLKERRPLILFPSEFRWHRPVLKNMIRLCEAGVILLSPSMAWFESQTKDEGVYTSLSRRALSFLSGLF